MPEDRSIPTMYTLIAAITMLMVEFKMFTTVDQLDRQSASYSFMSGVMWYVQLILPAILVKLLLS